MGEIKPLSYQTYVGLIKNHINSAIGAMELQAVKSTHIQKLYDSMKQAGLSGKLVRNVSAVLHKSFDSAIRQGIIRLNPCAAAGPPRVEWRKIKPPADREISQFLSAINDSPMRNAYALCLFAGLRDRKSVV